MSKQGSKIKDEIHMFFFATLRLTTLLLLVFFTNDVIPVQSTKQRENREQREALKRKTKSNVMNKLIVK